MFEFLVVAKSQPHFVLKAAGMRHIAHGLNSGLHGAFLSLTCFPPTA